MNGIKVYYGNQTKRISENVIGTYENLLKIVKKIFNLDQNSEESNNIHLYYIDKDLEKIQVASEEDFSEVCKYHKQTRENAVMKIELTVKLFKSSVFIDQMLDDVKMSESFAVVDKRELASNQNEQKNSLFNTNLGNTQIDMQISAVSNECEDLEIIKKEQVVLNNEIGIQIENLLVVESKSTETEKVITAEVAENTNILEHKDGYSQCDVDVKEKSCPISVDVEGIKIEQKSEKLAKDNNEFIIINNNSDNVVDEKPDNSKLIDEVLVSKIDQLISNRLSLLENNFKKMFEENQMQSRLYQQSLNYEVPSTSNHEIKEISEKKNATTDLILTNLENINILENKKVQTIEIDQVKPKIEIKSQQKPLIEVKDEVFSSISEIKDHLGKENYHFNEYCSICRFQILKNKYVCLLCDNFNLCSHCESQHLEHPLMKININNRTIINKEEIERFFKNQRREKKLKENKGGILKNLGKMFKHPENVIKIYPKNPTIFAMSKNSKQNFSLKIENSTNSKISEEIVIYPNNNKNFKVSTVVIDRMEPKEIRHIELTMNSPDKDGSYEFEISAKFMNNKVMLSPLKLIIMVTNPEDVDEANANIMFSNYEEVMKLPKEKRIALYNIVTGEFVRKDFKDILIIMRKHNFEIENALNEMMDDKSSFEDRNSNHCYNYSDLQY